MSSRTIQEAKKHLEQKVMGLEGVYGIGTVFNGSINFIEISVGSEDAKKKLTNIIPNDEWEGFPVEVIIRDQTKF